MDGITRERCQASYATLRDKRLPPHAKEKIHKMIVQPDMLYEVETVQMTSSHVKKLEVT